MRLHKLSLVVLLWAVPVSASVPTTMTYEGYLTSTEGAPLTTTVDMRFALYGAEEGGDALWAEDWSQVRVVAGQFQMQLGTNTPITAGLFDDATRFLEVTIDGELLGPRQALATVAYAFRAAQADNVSGRDINPRTVAIGETPVINEHGEWVGPPIPVEGGGNCWDGLEDQNDDGVLDAADCREYIRARGDQNAGGGNIVYGIVPTLAGDWHVPPEGDLARIHLGEPVSGTVWPSRVGLLHFDLGGLYFIEQIVVRYHGEMYPRDLVLVGDSSWSYWNPITGSPAYADGTQQSVRQTWPLRTARRISLRYDPHHVQQLQVLSFSAIVVRGRRVGD